MFRSLLFLAITALSIAVQVPAASQEIQPGADTQNSPVIRSSTLLVNVNVLVTDTKGQPMQGLDKDDFQISDNGHPQKIAFFSTREDREDKTDASHRVRSLAPGEYSNDPQRLGITDYRVTIILFDSVNTAYLSQAYSLERIRIFLRQLQPGDPVGIYVLSEKGLKVVYDVGQPAWALLEAMQRYDEAHKGATSSKGLVAAGNSTGLPELDRFFQGKDDQQPVSGLRRCDPQRIRIRIAAFQEIARRTLGLRGRKALIWVTEHVPELFPEENAFDLVRGLSGFCGMEPYDPDLILLEEPANLRSSFRRSRSATPNDSSSGSVAGTVPTRGGTRDRGLSEYDEFDLELRLLTQNNFAIYPVSAEGLQTVRLFGPGGMDTTAPLAHDPGEMTEKVVGAVHAVANVYAHQLMERLARRTGGRAYYDRNDLETGIRRALDDAKYGYELAYYPDHNRWNGDWRKIEVKVNRPAVTVVARGGYYAFPEPKLLPPKASKQLLEEIAASPLEDTEIPITVKLTRPAVSAPRL